MFTIILQDEINNEVSRVSLDGNELYLQRDDSLSFPYLSELSDCSYDIFAQKDVEAIVYELKNIRKSLSDFSEISHIDEIIRLAIICIDSPGYKLCFTPFSK